MTARWTERLVSRRGAALLVVVALASYALQALAWPLERGRDSWDYWLWFLQAADGDPPFSALQVFRTPVAPLVTGIPMWLGGAGLTEVVFAALYALSLLGWAWAVAPISRSAALATGVVLLLAAPYAGLFHEVSSDPVFAFVLAWWAGAVVRAWLTGSTMWLSAVGVGVALLTLTRPAAQIALLACVLVPLLARRRWTPALRGVATCLAAAVLPLAAWAAHNAVRYDDLAVARGSKAWVPFFRVAGDVDPANGDASRRLADAIEQEVLTQPPYASRDVDVADVLQGRRQPRGDPDDRALRPRVRLGLGLRHPLRRVARGDPGRPVALRRGSRRDVLGLPLPALRTRAARAAGADPRPARRARDRREAVPGADHRLAARRGGALRARLVPDGRPRAMRRARPRGGARATPTRRGATTSSSTPFATGTLSCRPATRTPGSRRRAAPPATAGRARSSGSPSRRSRSSSGVRAAPPRSSC